MIINWNFQKKKKEKRYDEIKIKIHLVDKKNKSLKVPNKMTYYVHC